jgi:hypothetical protein
MATQANKADEMANIARAAMIAMVTITFFIYLEPPRNIAR